MSIPKVIHVVWVGDESRRPDRFIESWRRHHPSWTVKIWGNRDLVERPWINAHHLEAMWNHELCGVADLMRYEILADEGGVAVDADSRCLRSLDDWLLDCTAFSCWENEIERPGLIATAAIGCRSGDPFMRHLVADLHHTPSVTDRRAWLTTGPQFLTDAHRRHRFHDLTILPSHFFIPHHYGGAIYTGDGPVYAEQAWASTLGSGHPEDGLSDHG